MSVKSRTKNSVLNIFVGLVYQIIILILTFISRTIFIKILGVDYLGINAIFINILSLLSLTELGFGSAFIYSMYKPLAEKDNKKLNALVNYYKKIYTYIAVIIGIVGLLLVPFLDKIIYLNISINNIIIFYLIFLFNTVLSYLFIYKTSIITADQKDYKLKIYNIILSIIQNLLQIIILIVYKNYLFYLLIQVIITILGNIIKSKKAEKLYPYILGNEKLDLKDKKMIWDNVKYMFFYQLGSVILNNTDNILISILVGTQVVGYYSNYTMIILTIVGFVSIIFTSLQSSLGDFNLKADKNKKFLIFKVLNLISYWIYGFCSICFCFLIQDFITIWLGKNYLLNENILYISIFNFYLQGVLYPIWCYRYTTSIFKHTQYSMLSASLLNIIFSIILGYKFGLFGILFATAISRIFTTMWYEPYKLFKIYFERTVKKYYVDEFKKIIILFLIISCMYFIINYLPNYNLYLNFLLKSLLCLIFPNLIIYILFKNSEEFKYLKEKILFVFSKRKDR